MKYRALIFWSSGKDACLALHRVLQNSSFEVVGLLSTVVEGSYQVGFHGVSANLLTAQAQALGLPLSLVPIPSACPNTEYERRLSRALKVHQDAGVTHLVFGDLFLSDIRQYRESFLRPLGFELMFPLWKEDTTRLAHEFIQLKFGALVCGVDPTRLSNTYLGRSFNEAFLHSLPIHVDPCGENGEFHTFVHDGPLFKNPIPFALGTIEPDTLSHFIKILLMP